jgi:cytochrome oxidase Cu insertion factor (SCO1/SenC/PrrC family)
MSETKNTELQPPKTGGRKILLLMAFIFVLPFTVAATLHLLNVHPASHSYGELINPPQALTFPVLHDIQGKEFKTQQWLKKWSMVIIDSDNCNTPCQEQAHLLKQVNTALDKDKGRVQRVLIVPVDSKAAVYAEMQKQYPDLLILKGIDAETVKFAGQFKGENGSVYLIDPLGNLMMRYPKNMNPKGLLTDLKKLLKNSWAG